MKIKLILFLSITVTFFSCDKKETEIIAPTIPDSNYIVFGHFYGECGGETCVENYKLLPNSILEDTLDNYPTGNGFITGNFTVLPNEKFLAAQDLITFFPSELLNESNEYIGMPDASDGGGLYIEYNFNGVHKRWFIDQFKQNVPAIYYPFMDKVNEKISLMQ
jgi:hypothetical protein